MKLVRRVEGIDSAAEVMRDSLTSLLPVWPTLVTQMSVFARRRDVRRSLDESSLSRDNSLSRENSLSRFVVVDSREIGECYKGVTIDNLLWKVTRDRFLY